MGRGNVQSNSPALAGVCRRQWPRFGEKEMDTKDRLEKKSEGSMGYGIREQCADRRKTRDLSVCKKK